MEYYRGFKLKVWNRLAQLKAMIVIRMPASSEELGRWIYIQADTPKNHYNPSLGTWNYQYIDFEIDKQWIGDDFGSDAILIREKNNFDTEEELFAFLATKSLDLAAFDTPWYYEFPL